MHAWAFLAFGLWAQVSLWAQATHALECTNEIYEAIHFSTCHVDLQKDDLRLFLEDDQGDVFGGFSNLATQLAEKDLKLKFAMNAGMFLPDYRPVGLYVEEGRRLKNIVKSASSGNFGLLPNGVFCIKNKAVQILETTVFLDISPPCHFATQSGPMLVIEGGLHPRFLPNSGSKFVRNGVGVSDNGRHAYFVLSNKPVTFHHFARYFRDYMGLNTALYLDGSVSRLFSPELHSMGLGRRIGPIVAVVEKAR